MSKEQERIRKQRRRDEEAASQPEFRTPEKSEAVQLPIPDIDAILSHDSEDY